MDRNQLWRFDHLFRPRRVLGESSVRGPNPFAPLTKKQRFCQQNTTALSSLRNGCRWVKMSHRHTHNLRDVAEHRNCQGASLGCDTCRPTTERRKRGVGGISPTIATAAGQTASRAPRVANGGAGVTSSLRRLRAHRPGPKYQAMVFGNHFNEQRGKCEGKRRRK